MALIDYTYFVGERNIPGAVIGSPVKQRLDFFILKYQRELLDMLFGMKMSHDITEQLATGLTSPALGYLVDGKFDELGAEGTTYRWKGLRQEEGPYKGSLIANYIYYWWLRDQATHTSNLGEVKSNTASDSAASSQHKQIVAWNEMAADVQALKIYLDEWAEAYPLFDAEVFATNYPLLSAPVNALNI